MVRQDAIKRIRNGAKVEILGGRTEDSAVIWIGTQPFEAGYTRAQAKQVTLELLEAARQVENGSKK